MAAPHRCGEAVFADLEALGDTVTARWRRGGARWAPISTFDLDIVHDRVPDNVARLRRALEEGGT
jgi:hypothetical protein